MPGTIHPNPDEVVRIAASEEIPRRISAPAGSKTKVFFGASVTDADKEVTLGDKTLSVDVAQPVLVITDANTLVLEGLAPVKQFDHVAEENNETKVKRVAPSESKKAEKDVAKANEGASIPSLSGEETPAPNEGSAAKPPAEQSKAKSSRSSSSKSKSKK